jgi:hypothetical protein
MRPLMDHDSPLFVCALALNCVSVYPYMLALLVLVG